MLILLTLLAFLASMVISTTTADTLTLNNRLLSFHNLPVAPLGDGGAMDVLTRMSTETSLTEWPCGTREEIAGYLQVRLSPENENKELH